MVGSFFEFALEFGEIFSSFPDALVSVEFSTFPDGDALGPFLESETLKIIYCNII